MSSSPNTVDTDRLDALALWLQSIGENPATLRPVSSDASARRYFRLDSLAGTHVAVDAPPDTEDNATFLAVASELRAAGIRVPAQHAAQLEGGFLLMEDFGDTPFETALTDETLQLHYDQAIDLLAALHHLPTHHRQRYAPELITRELGIFIDHYLTDQGVTLSESDRAAWNRYTQWTLAAFDAGEAVWTHRDFHCRNLMLLTDGSLGLIDFQGALHAPAGYDLASLLRDCYVDLPPAAFTRALDRYASAMGIADAGALRQSVDILGLQRHLKCLGLFVRFAREQGKRQYLAALPRTAAYARHVASSYPESDIVLSLLNRCQTEPPL